ncbi:ABC transporter substrate-binding protein [Streptomyces sp. NBC_01465]|uniref:ABC transporter substrate-binding protein n=1 Tax=Streptomyces sp. NBC_01465 TaxID=2903878 RepID=UPI002E3186FB|nr:ABC transporter substrate-binding protein [Streptomyces sp. NBC_01465]
MTGARRSTAFLLALTTAVGASLLTGCGVLPGIGGSREPLTVMTWAPEGTQATNMAGMPAMALAFSRWVNDNGGIDGHKIKVLTCNEQNTNIGAGNCARRAVKEGAVAVVGSYSQFGTAFMSPLELAGIPYIGGYGISGEEFTSTDSYPVNGGQAALLAGNGRQLARNCKRVALVRPDTIDGDDLPPLIDAGLAAGHRHEAADLRAADDAGDYSSVAAQALERVGAGPQVPAQLGKSAAREQAADGCVTAVLGERTETFLDSFRRVESEDQKVRISSVVGSVGQALVDSTGGKKGPFEGAYVTGWYPESGDARWNTMRGVIDKYAFGDDRLDADDAGVQTTWVAYTVLKQAVESVHQDSVSSRDLSERLVHGTPLTTGGLTPALRWDYGSMLASADFPRLVNRSITYQVVRQGRLVAQQKGFVDVGPTLENARASG